MLASGTIDKEVAAGDSTVTLSNDQFTVTFSKSQGTLTAIPTMM